MNGSQLSQRPVIIYANKDEGEWLLRGTVIPRNSYAFP